MSDKVRKISRNILLLLLGWGLLYVGIYFFKRGYKNYAQDQIVYKENNDVDYKVYLKENSFFDEPFLGKNKIYIASLIDYIDVTFSYNMAFEKKVSGFYKYSIKGIISANQQNSANNNYWKKEYVLSEEKIVNYQDLENIKFDTTIKFDYQQYNDLLMEFKNDFNLALDGNFMVVLSVENVISSNIVESGISKTSISSLEIPLTRATIEVPIKTGNDNNDSIMYSEIVYDNSAFYLLYKVEGVMLFIGSAFILLTVSLEIIKNQEKISAYKRQLRKILKTYDSIIVNTSSDINLADLTVIDVASFSELIDAHSEVRQPINCISSSDITKFVLIQDKMAWRYVLKKNI